MRHYMYTRKSYFSLTGVSPGAHEELLILFDNDTNALHPKFFDWHYSEVFIRKYLTDHEVLCVVPPMHRNEKITRKLPKSVKMLLGWRRDNLNPTGHSFTLPSSVCRWRKRK